MQQCSMLQAASKFCPRVLLPLLQRLITSSFFFLSRCTRNLDVAGFLHNIRASDHCLFCEFESHWIRHLLLGCGNFTGKQHYLIPFHIHCHHHNNNRFWLQCHRAWPPNVCAACQCSCCVSNSSVSLRHLYNCRDFHFVRRVKKPAEQRRASRTWKPIEMETYI